MSASSEVDGTDFHLHCDLDFKPILLQVLFFPEKGKLGLQILALNPTLTFLPYPAHHIWQGGRAKDRNKKLNEEIFIKSLVVD